MKKLSFLTIAIYGLLAISSVAQASITTIVTTIQGKGTITGNGINCGTDCSEAFTSVQYRDGILTATPATNYYFEQWIGDCRKDAVYTAGLQNNECRILINPSAASDTMATAVAIFKPMTATLKIEKFGGEGTVVDTNGDGTDGDYINCGTNCTKTIALEQNSSAILTATPTAGMF